MGLQHSTTASSSSDAAGRMMKRSSANTTGFHDATSVNDPQPAPKPPFHSTWTFPSSLLALLLSATSNSPRLTNSPLFNIPAPQTTYDDFKFLSFTKLFKNYQKHGQNVLSRFNEARKNSRERERGTR